jgi:hypothetical protein
LTQIPLFHGLTLLRCEEIFSKISRNICEINGKETRTRPCSVKAYEIDVYQGFVQMRQATPRQMFSLLFSHLGLTNYN